MAMHARWSRAGASNNTVMVVHCDGPLAPDRLRRALERLLEVCPWPAARLRRPLPWGRLHWWAPARGALRSPPVRHGALRSAEELRREIEGELGAAIDPRREPPTRFAVLDLGPETPARASVLLVTWFHPLMDPRGGQNLLRHLAALDAPGGQAPGDATVPAFVASPDPRPLAERGRLARRSLTYMRTLAPEPPVSPGARCQAPGPVRFRQERVTSPEGLPRPRATRETAWRLAVVGKAMADLWARRGLPDVPFLLPISVDLRPKGEPGPVFGNMLAFHFARFRPSETGDLPALARALRHQMADAVRDGQIEANAVAMEFLRYRPLSTMLRALPWAARGEVFSFNCADLGEAPAELDRLLGRRILNLYHVPAVLPRPGIGVFFNRCAGRDNLVVSWVEGAVDEHEAQRILDGVREGMGWIATT